MGRRPASDVTVSFVIDGVPFKLAQSTLTHLPGAEMFIRSQLTKGVSAPVASTYARMAAKLLREGRAADAEKISHPTERTAINAYWRWVESSYDTRVQPVVRAFMDDHVRKGIRWLRVHSIVGPTPGKKIPKMLRMPELHLDGQTLTAVMTPAEIAWIDSSAVTLHVPVKAVPAHTDPCPDCLVFELEPAQVEVLATAFERTWGHRDISRVPQDALLFGPPPVEGSSSVRQDTGPIERIVALAPPGQTADAITALRGSVARTKEAFRARLEEGVDTVLVNRQAIGEEAFERVLAVLRG